MAFILSKDRSENSLEEWNECWANYCSYLDSIKGDLPEATYEFAIAPWHYNFEDHRSPHDGWLESLTIKELPFGERLQRKYVDINLRLFAAYHDGYIEIQYKGVKSYQIATSFSSDHSHEDWLYDEIRLSSRGHCLHEIEWSKGSTWLIEAEGIFYNWTPFMTDLSNMQQNPS